jgi:hypothetical protein
MHIAGWGGFLLSILVWFSLFPPSGKGHRRRTYGVRLSLPLLMSCMLVIDSAWAAGRRRTPRRCCTEQSTTIKVRPTFRLGIHRF